jgi:tRNA (guanine37-N1)-methyltransferase
VEVNFRTSADEVLKNYAKVILMTPQGKPFTQALAKKLAQADELIFVSGRYEGFDERIRNFVDDEISIGDYVLMGGELPALVITEAVLRMIPGVLGKDESADKESFSESLLEYPQYTKPETWEVKAKGKLKKLAVPKVLRTGHHANIEQWRHEEALKRTKKRRPDLLA